MKVYTFLFVAALLILPSSSSSSSGTHLRSLSNDDDPPEFGDDKRGLSGICVGVVKTYYYHVDIAMLSPYGLNCNSKELKQIGTVIQNSFDNVVNLDKSLAPLTLNTTICTGSVTQTKFRRRLATPHTYKYSGGGKCNLCSSDNKDRMLQSLLPSFPSNVYFPTSPSLTGTTSANSSISYAQVIAIKGIPTAFSPNSTLYDYKALLQALLNMYLTNQVTAAFGSKPGSCLYMAQISMNVTLTPSNLQTVAQQTKNC